MWAVVLVLAFLILLAAIAVLSLIHLVYSLRNKVPPVPTPRMALPELMEALNLPPSGCFYDIGSGDGRVLKRVAEERPGLRVVGIENNPVANLLAYMRVGSNVKLIRNDILGVSLRDADRIFAYLGPELMVALEPKLERELKKGARVVAQQFALPNRQPTLVRKLRHARNHAGWLYIYDY
jgi:SAM-dependent methyltransferase